MQLVLASIGAQRLLSRRAASQKRPFVGQQLSKAVSNGCRTRAFFNFAKKPTKEFGQTFETRECYTADDAKDYYTITGLYAIEGSYDKFEQMLATGQDPVDIIMLIACSEGDDGKVEECLNAGAHATAKDLEGRSAIDIAEKDEIKQMLQAALAKA